MRTSQTPPPCEARRGEARRRRADQPFIAAAAADADTSERIAGARCPHATASCADRRRIAGCAGLVHCAISWCPRAAPVCSALRPSPAALPICSFSRGRARSTLCASISALTNRCTSLSVIDSRRLTLPAPRTLLTHTAAASSLSLPSVPFAAMSHQFRELVRRTFRHCVATCRMRRHVCLRTS